MRHDYRSWGPWVKDRHERRIMKLAQEEALLAQAQALERASQDLMRLRKPEENGCVEVFVGLTPRKRPWWRFWQ
jgi:hypothetical protein